MIRTKTPPMAQHGGFLSALKHKYSFTPNNYNFNRFEPQSKLIRVTKKIPCRICGKPNWCSYTEDGELALCMREPSGSTKTAQNGANIHVLISAGQKKSFRTFRIPYKKERKHRKAETRC